MSLPRIVVDNSAMQPAFFPEATSEHFDAGLVTNRARSLVHAIRVRRVNAYVPPSFFREFLNVAVHRLDDRGGRTGADPAHVREQWEELLRLPLIVTPLQDIIADTARLAFEDLCPPEDSWYVATAIYTRATFWMSHAHRDGLVGVAQRHVPVRLLSNEASAY